jgi:hypothetical protein
MNAPTAGDSFSPDRGADAARAGAQPVPTEMTPSEAIPSGQELRQAGPETNPPPMTGVLLIAGGRGRLHALPGTPT